MDVSFWCPDNIRALAATLGEEGDGGDVGGAGDL